MADETLVGLPDLGKASVAHLRETLGLPSTAGVRPAKEILDCPRADPLGPALLLCKHAGTEVLSHAYLAFNCAPRG
jgi:hypothetical protein